MDGKGASAKMTVSPTASIASAWADSALLALALSGAVALPAGVQRLVFSLKPGALQPSHWRDCHFDYTPC